MSHPNLSPGNDYKIKDSLTSWASVLAGGERGFSERNRAVIIVGVQLPLVVRPIHWLRSEGQERVRILVTSISVGVCRAVGGVGVISCVVGSSSFQSSDRTDELRSSEVFHY